MGITKINIGQGLIAGQSTDLYRFYRNSDGFNAQPTHIIVLGKIEVHRPINPRVFANDPETDYQSVLSSWVIRYCIMDDHDMHTQVLRNPDMYYINYFYDTASTNILTLEHLIRGCNSEDSCNFTLRQYGYENSTGNFDYFNFNPNRNIIILKLKTGGGRRSIAVTVSFIDKIIPYRGQVHGFNYPFGPPIKILFLLYQIPRVLPRKRL